MIVQVISKNVCYSHVTTEGYLSSTVPAATFKPSDTVPYDVIRSKCPQIEH